MNRQFQIRQFSSQGIQVKSPQKHRNTGRQQPRLVRDVMASDPYLSRFYARRNADDFPNAEDLAEASRILSEGYCGAQGVLALRDPA